MSVVAIFRCDGCDAVAEGTARLKKEFVSVSGRSHGVGSSRWTNTPDDVAPFGWIAADPYTFCTYCPTCWTEIQSGSLREESKP
jgi:hypothetical protein